MKFSCPFCTCDMLELTQADPDLAGPWYVWCHGCGAQGPSGNGQRQALVRWNRRNDKRLIQPDALPLIAG